MASQIRLLPLYSTGFRIILHYAGWAGKTISLDRRVAARYHRFWSSYPKGPCGHTIYTWGQKGHCIHTLPTNLQGVIHLLRELTVHEASLMATRFPTKKRQPCRLPPFPPPDLTRFLQSAFHALVLLAVDLLPTRMPLTVKAPGRRRGLVLFSLFGFSFACLTSHGWLTFFETTKP